MCRLLRVACCMVVTSFGTCLVAAVAAVVAYMECKCAACMHERSMV
jgi:hypothetical protein